MCSDDGVWLIALFATQVWVRILGIRVNHSFAAQIDPLRLEAGAENTR